MLTFVVFLCRDQIIAASVDDCSLCPAGRYCPEFNMTYDGIDCPDGSFCPEGARFIRVCAAGMYIVIRTVLYSHNYIAHRMAKTPLSFGHPECNWVVLYFHLPENVLIMIILS